VLIKLLRKYGVVKLNKESSASAKWLSKNVVRNALNCYPRNGRYLVHLEPEKWLESSYRGKGKRNLVFHPSRLNGFSLSLTFPESRRQFARKLFAS
jgi:hypothetical protein